MKQQHHKSFSPPIFAKRARFHWLLIVMAWVMVVTGYPVEPQDRPGVFLVLGETQSIKPFETPNKRPTPLLVATLRITEVLRGPVELVGQTFFAFTSDVTILGNRVAITPPLKTGEVCICAIARNMDAKKELWMLSGVGAYPVGDDLLPSVKGREMNNITDRREDFDGVLQRLRHRRDHPEKYKQIEPKAEPLVPAAPKAITQAVVLESKPKPLPPPVVPTPNTSRDANKGWWVAAAVILTLCACVWLMSRK